MRVTLLAAVFGHLIEGVVHFGDQAIPLAASVESRKSYRHVVLKLTNGNDETVNILKWNTILEDVVPEGEK